MYTVHVISLVIFLGFKDLSYVFLQYLVRFLVFFIFSDFLGIRYSVRVTLRYCAFGSVTYVVKIVFHAFLSSLIFKSGCILF